MSQQPKQMLELPGPVFQTILEIVDPQAGLDADGSGVNPRFDLEVVQRSPIRLQRLHRVAHLVETALDEHVPRTKFCDFDEGNTAPAQAQVRTDASRCRRGCLHLSSLLMYPVH